MSLLVDVVAPAVGAGGLVGLVYVCVRHGSDAILKLAVAIWADKERRESCIKALSAAKGQDHDPPDLPELPGP